MDHIALSHPPPTTKMDGENHTVSTPEPSRLAAEPDAQYRSHHHPPTWLGIWERERVAILRGRLTPDEIEEVRGALENGYGYTWVWHLDQPTRGEDEAFFLVRSLSPVMDLARLTRPQVEALVLTGDLDLALSLESEAGPGS